MHFTDYILVFLWYCNAYYHGYTVHMSCIQCTFIYAKGIKFLQNFVSSSDRKNAGMKICKNTSLLQNDGGRQRQEDYPTSAAFRADVR